MNIGERIQNLRKDAGMSQEQLGEKLGVSRQAVSKWETGESLPELDKIILIAQAFGVTTDELLRGNGPEGGNPYGGEEHQGESGGEGWQTPFTDADGFEAGPFAPIFRLAKRKGYIAGYYYMGIGALMGLMVLFFWIASNSMFNGFPLSGGDHFTTPLNIFVILGSIVAVCVFALGVAIVIKMKKYKNKPE